MLGSERLTGALLDRLTHHVSVLTMNGDSYRLKQSAARRRVIASSGTEQNQATQARSRYRRNPHTLIENAATLACFCSAVDKAYAFSIAPLIARAGEIGLLAARVTAERERLRAMKERLSLCRRDIAKLIETGLEAGVAGDWTMVHGHFWGLVLAIPRSARLVDIQPIVEEMEMLRQEVLNLLETRINAANMTGNESQAERHIQNTKPESILNQLR